ncbi:hypothetical protein [Arenibaculum sp.]|uniref:hypothetical protein n=1 Tax=Arenibaculum sp. TaxID=2865862 RepID=UPI002E139C41|nr:hypothetical protein [Arenibaculum sp.]
MPTGRPSIPRRLAALLVPLALGACANPRAETALAARDLLVGMPTETLLSCAGVPERTATVDNVDFFTYESSSTVAYPYSGAGFVTARRWYPGWGYGLAAPVGGYDVYSQACEATFTLRDGRVERVVYSGQSSQCYAIVANCLAPAS